MLRVLWQFQQCSRVPPVVVPKMLDNCLAILNAQHSWCSTSTPYVDHNLSKYRRGSLPKSLHSRLALHYNVDYLETKRLAGQSPLSLKLKDICTNNLNEVLLHCKKEGYKWEEVKNNLDILLLSLQEIKLRRKLFDEFSIPSPRLHDVLHTGTYLQTKVAVLRTHGVYGKTFDVMEPFFKNIEIIGLPDDVISHIKKHLKNIEDLSLADIHLYILAHYLCQRFDVDLANVKDMIRTNPYPTWKALTSYPRICDILIKVLKVDFSDIMDRSLFLNIEAGNAAMILRSHLKIGSTPLVELARKHPKLLLVPHEKLLKWTSLFEKYNVRRVTITPGLIKLFNSIIFKQAEERLQILCKVPDFEIITASEHFSGVLKKSIGIKKILEMSHSGMVHNNVKSIFSKNLHSCNDSARKVSGETRSLIAMELGIDLDNEAELKILSEVRLRFGLTNTLHVVKLLKAYGFTKEQMLEGVFIIGFEYSSLKDTLQDFSTLPEVQPFKEWMKDLSVIHLLAYIIEKKRSPHCF